MTDYGILSHLVKQWWDNFRRISLYAKRVASVIWLSILTELAREKSDITITRPDSALNFESFKPIFFVFFEWQAVFLSDLRFVSKTSKLLSVSNRIGTQGSYPQFFVTSWTDDLSLRNLSSVVEATRGSSFTHCFNLISLSCRNYSLASLDVLDCFSICLIGLHTSTINLSSCNSRNVSDPIITFSSTREFTVASSVLSYCL